MIRFAVLAAIAALPALAEGPDEYRAKAALTLAGAGELHRVVLPPGVLRETRSDLADVRIFDADGVAVPIALAGEPGARQLVMAARGNAPFSLAFGKSDAQPVAVALSSMIPGYAPAAENRLPQDTVGEVTTRPDSGLQHYLDNSIAIRIILWFMLFAAVAWIAYVTRRTFAPNPPSEPPESR